ncbi:MAG: hypothetical protein LYZ69_04845 [Nitrososphaerales archaeon]|nr:hypothetical protein [Nitrososphaerales archaeon]
MASVFFEPSLGLAAFSLLMWITMPWAFAEHMKAEREKLYLVLSQRLFFTSGLIFVATVIIDLFQEPAPSATSVPLTLYFGAGAVALFLGMFFAYLVVESYTNYWGVKKFMVFGAAIQIGYAVSLMVFGSFYAFEFFYLSPHFSVLPLLYQAYVVSLPIAVAFSVYCLARAIRIQPRGFIWMTLLFTAPFLFRILLLILRVSQISS